ncbi:MAG: carbamoyltransferase HypF, partial [Acidimicrobiales bacterium]|nr:carbamoyltransferase HypF [Acidimicrobiales bacterium]
LRDDAPPLARVDRIDRTDLAAGRCLAPGFSIVGSRRSKGARTLVPPDTAVCDDCLAELYDPGDRRFGHPFITCTNCGPRFTIITDLPYDRPNTTMASFAMCPACEAEYRDPTSRRYHAQPIACHECGPTLAFVDSAGRVQNGDPIDRAAEALRCGSVVAIKGLGGFHLACDATNDAAVAMLRERKHRPDKPFALMVPNLAAARHLVALDEHEARELSSPARPVVLARALGEAGISQLVAPDNPLLGVMLPYTPVQHLLFASGIATLVMTSGNRGGEPIVFRDGELFVRLGPLVDGVLTHDRPIEVPCDDSVVRVEGPDLLPIRRARGFAPLPVSIPHADRSALAVGGELKNTCTVLASGNAWVSQHIGDMENLETVRAFEAIAARLSQFYRADPDVVVADAHPGYATTGWAHRAQAAPVLEVQHHWAHVASVMAEHHLNPDTQVLGIAFDGTGYGTDGTIWGGELLLADGHRFERVGHLAAVNLPGGDGAVRYPNRMALAHLHAAGIAWDPSLPPLIPFGAAEPTLLATQLDKGIACVRCTSMGRLFDAIASLVGLRHEISYEAQAAIELEMLAERAAAPRSYRFAVNDGVLDPAPVLHAIVADIASDVDRAAIAAGFHHAVADATGRAVEWVLQSRNVDAVALTGGCFQNALLLRLCRQRLRRLELPVLAHRVVPPNDGGLSLGQAYIAATSRSLGQQENP